jgi:hypothetical protein
VITDLFLIICFVAIPTGYAYILYRLVRFSFCHLTQTHFKILTILIILISTLWIPIITPIRSYLTYLEFAGKLSGAHVNRVVVDVDRVHAGTDSNMFMLIAGTKQYNNIEYYNNSKKCFMEIVPATGNGKPLIGHPGLELNTKLRATAKYIVNKRFHKLNEDTSLYTVEIKTTDGELLGKHGTVLWWGSGIVAYFDFKGPNVRSRAPLDQEASEIAFIQSVLRPRKAVPTTSAQ